MTNYIELAGERVGPNYSPVVFAELGINHGGSVKVAKKMAKKAIDAGARFIKHQTHIPEAEMSREADSVIPGNATQSIFKVISDCSLSESEELELADFVRNEGAVFFSTPFSREAVDRLENLEVPFYKVGSGECSNLPFLDFVASTGKPVVLSTGMNSIESVKKSVAVLKSRNVSFALLHTTNLYPTPSNLLRLGGLKELSDAFDAPVGLSDHSVSNAACIAAVGLGASILERHFVDRKSRKGPDVICSMDPAELNQLLEWSQQVFLARGGSKYLSQEERVTSNFAFASICAIEDIHPGQTFTSKNIFPIRPGTGEFGPDQYHNILGRKAAVNIPKRSQLSSLMIEGFEFDKN